MSIDTRTLASLSPEDKRRLLAEMANKKASRQRSYPMSFSQQRLWFLDQLNPGNPFYNVEAVTPIRAALNPAALERAINAIVQRHEILRTTFREIDNEPRQIVANELKIKLETIDLRVRPADQREQEKQRILTADAVQPFQLDKGPLVRTKLLLLGPDDQLLTLRMHHIVSDGWSMGIFARELQALYGEYVAYQPADLPHLPIQYADYSVWQRDWLAGPELKRQLTYWCDQLGGVPTLELPTDRPRPAIQTHQGAFHNIACSRVLTDRLKALGRKEECTLFMTLLSAFVVLLHRWSGQDDIVVGTYIANRNRAEVENLIGFFLNTLVLRTRLDDVTSFRSLMRRVRDVALGAYTHQDLPFELLVDKLQPERDLSRNPLFQVTFQVSNTPTQAAAENSEESIDFKRGTAIFDLAFMLFETVDGLAGQFEYSTDLFDADTIRRMADQYLSILEAAVANPDQHIDRLPLQSDAERAALVSQWNRTDRDFPLDVGLAELFAAQVCERPEAVAFIEQDRRISFAELDRESNRIANVLRANSDGRERVVALYLDRSIRFVTAVLGAVKAGVAWLPLDPAHPAERLGYMLEDSGADIVIADRAAVQSLPVADRIVLRLDQDDDPLYSQPDTPGASNNALDQVAYVIYTSGSTGRPKGVAATQRQILNRMHWMWEEYPFGSHEYGAFKTATGFVDSVWEVFGPLLRGVSSVILSQRTVQDPHALVRCLADHQVTRLWLVPSLLRVILDHFPDLATRLPALKFWVSSGEPLSVELVKRFGRAMPGAKLYNLYGTSEVWDATWCDPADAGMSSGRVPIGRPIHNVSTYVLDHQSTPVPLGVPGELYVAGCGLAKGYLNQPELTDKAFVTLEGIQYGGIRAYRTGDRVLQRPDGHIEYLGRIDQQIKLRGVRVEPSEVEAVMSAHPQIRMAAVCGRLVADDLQLWAWYMPTEEAPEYRELREWLAQRLPQVMIPTQMIALDQMPLTASGKIDRKSLPDPPSRLQSTVSEYVAPEGPVEQALAGIWGALLPVDRVGRDDNFFGELGGHSLLATQLVSRIRDLFQVELPLSTVFEHSSVRGFARQLVKHHAGGVPIEATASMVLELATLSNEQVEQLLANADRPWPVDAQCANPRFDFTRSCRTLLARRQAELGGGTSALAPIKSDRVSGRAPLSYSQQRLWFQSLLMPPGAPIVIETVTPIPGRLHVPALKKAIDTIIRRHDILRVTIQVTDGIPEQVVAPSLAIELPVVDLSPWAPADRQREAQRVMAEQRLEPIDLAKGPLLSATLLRLDDEEHVLQTRIHHIVADGWSMGVFSRELQTLYRDYAADREPSLPDLPLQYPAFAKWQRETQTPDTLQNDLAYWKSQLAHLPPPTLGTDRPRPATSSFRGGHHRFFISNECAGQLDSICREQSCTLFMLLLAAFKLLLFRYSGQADIVVGTHVAGRQRQELEDLIGFFLNNLVIRTTVDDSEAFSEVLKRVRQITLDAYSHQHVPFELLVAELNPARNLNHNPLYQIVFHLNNAPGQVSSEDASAALDINREVATVDLSMLLVHSDNGLTGMIEYSVDLFDESSIVRMSQDYQKLLDRIAAGTDCVVSELVAAVPQRAAASPATTLGGDGRHAKPPVSRPITQRTATEMETEVLGMWQELLGRQDIRIDDNFFELGGHSLSAVQLAARLRDKFSRDVAVRTVFDHPTLADLAATLIQLPRLAERGAGRAIARLARDKYRRHT